MTGEPTGELHDLDVETCLQLLSGSEIGRLAVSVDDGPPHVVPVTYALDGATIVFRTDDGTKLSALRTGPVSFQVDEIDRFHRTGWSVLVRGVAEEIDPGAAPTLRPWGEGPLQHWIRIVPTSITGRHIALRPSEDRHERGYV